MYAKIKYSSFENNNDYCRIIDDLKSHLRKLSKTMKNDLLNMSDLSHSDEELNEHTALENLGKDPTFDRRTGNKYTRKLHIKEVYNKYYYGSEGSNRASPRKTVQKYSSLQKTIRSQDNKQGKFNQKLKVA